METASLSVASSPQTPFWTSLWMKDLRGAGAVRVLEAAAGASRRRRLEEAAVAARQEGARVFLLDVGFADGGPWAGLRDLFSELLPELRALRPDLLALHGAELGYVLPTLKSELDRPQTLTDLAPPEEKVRNYPADRAYRVVHGLVDLLADLKGSLEAERSWSIVGDNFDDVSHIGRRFFQELMRRKGEEMRTSLLLAVAPGTAVEASWFPNGLEKTPLDLPSDEEKVDRETLRARALELEALVDQNVDLIEVHIAKILRCFRLAGEPQKVFRWQCRALEVYNSLGFYEDALEYGREAWRLCGEYRVERQDLRWALFVKLFMSIVGLQRGAEAEQLVETSGILEEPMSLERRAQLLYLVSMLYTRYLPERDLVKGEDYLERALADLEQARPEMPEAEYHFYRVFNRNGLALVRHLQGRYQEAIDLCREGFERLECHLQGEKHKLHRSVLLYNIAQVYGVIGSLADSVAYYSAAIEMDPAYSEYYNDRGSLYLKMGRLAEARADYLRAIELSPPYPEVWTNLGQCHRLAEEWDEALRAYSVAIDLQPQSPVALFGRGQVLEALGREAEALTDYDRALELRPDRWDTLGCRAVLLYQKGESERSLADLDRAVELAPDKIDLRFNRSVVLADLDRAGDALADLDTCLRLATTAEERADFESRVTELRASVA